MTVQTSISDRLAEAEAALKAGLLNDYAPAVSAAAAGPKVPMSWGSAMRR